MKYFLLLLLPIFFSCSTKNTSVEKDFKYLSQEPPNHIPQIFGPDIISVKDRFDMGITIAPDGKSIVFGVMEESKPNNTCLYQLRYSDKKWKAPTKAFLEDNQNTYFPMFDSSGTMLYFAKSFGDSQPDIWEAAYKGGKAIHPRPLDSIINSDSREAGHGIAMDGSLYFTSNRDDQHQCCGDIYRAKLESSEYQKIEKMKELSSPADEESLFISPKGDYIIIQAWKQEVASKHDLYISYKTKSDSWTAPQRLPSEINSKEIEQRPFISPDSNYLFFSRTSVLKKEGIDHYESDIYWVHTKAVFKPFLYNPISAQQLNYKESFSIQVPNDLFKDIDDKMLSYSLTFNDHSELPEWVEFDEEQRTLTGVWNTKESAIVKVLATDPYGNKSVLPLLETKEE